MDAPMLARLHSIEGAEQCYRMPHTDAEIEQEAARETILSDEIHEYHGEALDKDPGKTGVAIALSLQKARDACANISPSDILNWRSMLEDLASSGNSAAQLAYARAVWQDSLFQAEMDLDPSDFSRRLEIARDFLWDNVTNGNCDNTALNVLSRVPQLGPATNYIGWSLLGQQGLDAVDKHRWSQVEVDRERKAINAEFDRVRALVPANQLEESNQAIAQLSQFNCAGR